MGLYQGNVTVFNQTFTVAGTYNSPAFSEANWNGGVLFTQVGTVTGTTPTLALQVQLFNTATGLWVACPTLASSLAPAASTIGLSMNVTSYTPVAAALSAAVVGSAYIGSTLRVAATVGGTGSLSVPLTLQLDMRKLFPDNA